MTSQGPSTRQQRRAYPGKVAIRHVVDAARACGLDVAGVEVNADGTIRVVEARALPAERPGLYEQWQDKV